MKFTMLLLQDALSIISIPKSAPSVVFFRDIPSLVVGTALLAGASGIIYAFRVRSVMKQKLKQMERRTDEQLRECRHQHDVLLQSIHGLMLRFHYIAETLPEEHPSRSMLQIALQRADGLIIEARKRGEELMAGVDGNQGHSPDGGS